MRRFENGCWKTTPILLLSRWEPISALPAQLLRSKNEALRFANRESGGLLHPDRCVTAPANGAKLPGTNCAG
jgi:hypothetical protein